MRRADAEESLPRRRRVERVRLVRRGERPRRTETDVVVEKKKRERREGPEAELRRGREPAGREDSNAEEHDDRRDGVLGDERRSREEPRERQAPPALPGLLFGRSQPVPSEKEERSRPGVAE